MAGEYTIGAIVAPLAVTVLELAVLRTGVFRLPRYWLTVAIVLAFQLPVDAALTGGTPPVVAYRATATSGVRIGPIPIEDFGFGFALVTLTLIGWLRAHRTEPDDGR